MKFIGKILLSIGGILIAVLLSELFLRFSPYGDVLRTSVSEIKDYYEYDALAGYDIKPNYPVTTTTVDFVQKYSIWSNSIGCFDYEYNGQEDYLLLVGDSFTHSFAPFESKWGTVLEKIIGVRTLKCGLAGYATKQELLKSQKIINAVKKSPKLIIVGYLVGDDIDADYLFPAVINVDGHLVSYKGIADLKTGKIVANDINQILASIKRNGAPDPSAPILFKINYYFSQHSLLFVLLKTQIKNIIFSNKILANFIGSQYYKDESHISIAYLDPGEYAWLKNAWAIHLSNFKQLSNLAGKNNAKLLVVMIPTREQVYNFLKDKTEKTEGVNVSRPNTTASDFFKSENISYIDLLPFFRDYADQAAERFLDPQKDLYWKFDAHWNIKGNYLAALLVAKYITENNLAGVYDKKKILDKIAIELRSLKQSSN